MGPSSSQNHNQCTQMACTSWIILCRLLTLLQHFHHKNFRKYPQHITLLVLKFCCYNTDLYSSVQAILSIRNGRFIYVALFMWFGTIYEPKFYFPVDCSCSNHHPYGYWTVTWSCLLQCWKWCFESTKQ